MPRRGLDWSGTCLDVRLRCWSSVIIGWQKRLINFIRVKTCSQTYLLPIATSAPQFSLRPLTTTAARTSLSTGDLRNFTSAKYTRTPPSSKTLLSWDFGRTISWASTLLSRIHHHIVRPSVSASRAKAIILSPFPRPPI